MREWRPNNRVRLTNCLPPFLRTVCLALNRCSAHLQRTDGHRARRRRIAGTDFYPCFIQITGLAFTAGAGLASS